MKIPEDVVSRLKDAEKEARGSLEELQKQYNVAAKQVNDSYQSYCSVVFLTVLSMNGIKKEDYEKYMFDETMENIVEKESKKK